MNNWVAFKTILMKEIIRFTRIWMQTLLPPAITMALYFIVFGNLIGRRIGLMSGFSYVQYIAPGLIMMSIITNSYSNVASSFFSSKFQRSIEELLVAPVPNYLILSGYVAGGVLRGLGVGVMVTIVALFFTKLKIHHIWFMLLSVLLSSTLFCLAGFVNGLLGKKFDDIAIIPTFVLTPLTYLGGVFYSVSLLPEFWRGVSMANPILYMVNAFRFGILGVSDVNVELSLLIIILFVIALFALNMALLNRGVGIRK